MTRRRLAVMSMLLLVACGGGVPNDLTFEHDNSCGRSFAVVNDSGTAQLSLSPLNDDDLIDIESGVVDLSDETWSGRLEVGSGLNVWPCSDIATDFDDVDVDVVWRASSGTVQIPQALPATGATGGGGVREPVTIVATDLVFTNDDETVEIPSVTLSSRSWGFYGG